MTLMRPFVSLPQAPQEYSMQDQNALRRALAQALDSVTNVTGNQSVTYTGDVTGSGVGSVALTLATVNSNVGAFGSSTAIPTVTVNAKGLITAVTTNAVVAPAGTLTGTTLAANVVTSSLTTIGTLIAGAVPASLVTAGTFGAGNYATAGTLAVAAGATTNALTVTTTGAIQASLRYDASTRLDVSVAATTGLATYALSVSGNVNTRHYFTEPMEISASGTTLYTTGLGVSINKQGSSTDAELVGASITAIWNSSGAVTDLVGLRTNPILGGGGGTIVNAISQRVSALTASCTTAYGLLVDAITGGATNYAIYTNAGPVRFGDVVTFAASSATVNFNDHQALSFRIENRTSDPGSPSVGRLWLRTDL